jgi:Helix-turn-helix
MAAPDRIQAYATKLRQDRSFRDLLLANVAIGINQQRLRKLSPKTNSALDLINLYSETEKLGALQRPVITKIEKLFKNLLKKETFWAQTSEWILQRLDRWETDNHSPVECWIPGVLSAIPDPNLPEEAAWRESILISACAFYVSSELLSQLDLTNRSLDDLETWLGIKKVDSQATSPQLFKDQEFERISTGYPILTGAQALINNQWQDGEYPAWRKRVGDGFIEHQIVRQNPESSRIELVPGKAAWEIIQQFGPEAAYIFLIFSSYATDAEKPWEGRIRLRGTDLIKLCGWDTRTDLTLGKKLRKIGGLVQLVCSLSVSISNIDVGNRRYNIATSAMWLLEELEYAGQLALTVDSDQPGVAQYEAEEPDELLIGIIPGSWTEKFLSQSGQQEKTALREYGYLAKSTLQINPYRKRLAAKLAIFLTVMSRIQHDGRYEVQDLLERLEPQELLTEIAADKRKRNSLIDQWDSALLTLKQVGWQVEFDPATYPEDLQPGWSLPSGRPTTKIRPKLWLDRWLKGVVTIKPTGLIQQKLGESKEAIGPPVLPTAGPNKVPSTGPIAVTHEIPGRVLEQALAAKGLSRAKLAEQLGLDRSLVTRWINGSRPIQPKHREQIWQVLGVELQQVMARIGQ